jgi:peptide/nickel transport system substrate-binding protein
LKLVISRIVLSLSLIGLMGTASQAGADTTKGKTLKIVNSYKCASIDPAYSGSHWLFDWAAADTFMKVTENGEIVPNVLESLERLDDLTWKLTLREGVQFQNGKKLDGEMAAKAIRRQLEKSKRAQMLLGGAEVAVDGPLTLTITTPAPNASVPRALAARNSSLFVYDADVMEAAAKDYAKIVNAGAFTAPYEIVAYTPEYFKLKGFDGHWAGTPALTEIEIRVVPDEQARIKAVQSGEADLAFYPPFEAAYTLKDRDDAFFCVSAKALQSLLIYLNLQAPPFDDVHVRRAFGLGIDYRQIAEDVSEGIFEQAKGLYPHDLPYAVHNQRFAPVEAGEILEKTGWKKGAKGIRYKNGESLTISLLLSPRGPEVKTVCIAMQDQLQKIGMDVKLVVNEDVRGFQKENPKGWHSSVGLTGSLSGTGDYIQPFIRRFTTGGDWNFGKIAHADIDEIGKQIQKTFDLDGQYQLLQEAQKILVEDHVFILSSCFKRFMVVASPAWKNYQVSSYRRHITFETAP